MRRLLPREALSPILGRLVASIVLVLASFVMLLNGLLLPAVGALALAFLVVGGAKRAR